MSGDVAVEPFAISPPARVGAVLLTGEGVEGSLPLGWSGPLRTGRGKEIALEAVESLQEVGIPAAAERPGSVYWLGLLSGRQWRLGDAVIRRGGEWVVGRPQGGGGRVWVRQSRVARVEKLASPDAPSPPWGLEVAATPPEPPPAPTGEGERWRALRRQGQQAMAALLPLLEGEGPGGGQRRSRLGDLLQEEGLVTREVVEEALRRQKGAPGRRLGEVLREMGAVEPMAVARVLARRFGLPHLSLAGVTPDPRALALMEREVAQRLGVLPLYADDQGVIVAVGDPTTLNFQELAFVLGRNPTLVLAAADQIREQLRRCYAREEEVGEESGLQRSARTLVESASHLPGDGVREEPQLLAPHEEGSVVEMVNRILRDAVHQGVSDIHLVPDGAAVRLAYRIDGVLREQVRLPNGLLPLLSSRIKVMSGMNITERRLPQDGMIRARHGEERITIRVSILPSHRGETLVLRLFRQRGGAPDLEGVEVTAAQRELLKGALHRARGLILVTGPTGSGKSTTLAACLETLLRFPEQLHILSVEDPVEREMPGITQIEINAGVGLTFPRVLRNVLRHDPDVVMVGEIRDGESAQIALQTALTGHLVLSTLHTNDAPGAVTRLLEMGIPRFMVGYALSLVMAQRLVRRLCGCAGAAPGDGEEGEWYRQMAGEPPPPGAGFRRPVGCDRCGGSGFAGRLMLAELLPVDRALRGLIARGCGEEELVAAATPLGYRPLFHQGLEYAVRGATTLGEVMRHWEP